MPSDALRQLEGGLFWGIGFTVGFIIVIVLLTIILLPASIVSRGQQ